MPDQSENPRSFFRQGLVLSLGAITRFLEQQEGGEVVWTANNAAQQALLDVVNATPELEVTPGTTVLAGYETGPLNEALDKAGYPDLQMPESMSPPDVGAITIFDTLVTWKVPGVPIMIRIPALNYHLRPGVEIWASVYGECQAIQIPLREAGYEVYLLPFGEGEHPSSLGMLSWVKDRLELVSKLTKDEDTICRFPMACMENEPNLETFIGMGFSGGGRLSFLRQINRLKLDHKGARIQSATAAGGTRSTSEPPTIKGSFAFVLMHKGKVIIVFRVTPECFRDPNKESFYRSAEVDVPSVQPLPEPVSIPVVAPSMNIVPPKGSDEKEGIVTFV